MKKLIILAIILLLSLSTMGQNDSLAISTEMIMDPIEEQLENSNDESTQIPEELIDEIFDLAGKNQYNLNDLSYEVATTLFKLTDYQYYQLQLYIELYGSMATIYELAAIEGFGYSELSRLMPYVIVAPVPVKLEFFKNFFKRSSSNLLVRYVQTTEKSTGYDTNRTQHYAGSPIGLCFRYNFSTQNKLFIKIAGEKDAGEQFFRGAQKQGFDFYSGSISIKEVGFLKSSVLGDYRINFGQGLVAGSSLLSGKGSGVGGVRRFSTAIRAIAPTNESTFLRGAAATIGKTKFNGTLFAGKRVDETGYAFGGDFLYRHALFKVGTSVVCTTKDSLRKSQPDRPFQNVFNNFNMGLNYQFIVHHQLIFGELALNEIGKLGIIQGVMLTLSPATQVAILFRHYDKAYYAPLGSAFGALPSNQGETGCYLTANHILSQHCELNFYGDYYFFNRLTYRTDAPSTGADIGTTLQYSPNRNHQLWIKYLWKNKEKNDSENPYYRELVEINRHKIRLIWTSSPCQNLKLSTEIDCIIQHYSKPSNYYKGFLSFQDIDYDIPKWKASLRYRIAYFDTDRYEERLYAYENDVYYAFTIGNYYNKGIRTYLVLKYQYKIVSMWLKIAQTYYINKNKISSGMNEIDKPHKTDVRLQIMINY